MIENWKNKRVTVMGLGRFGGGVGVTRWLRAQGAKVTVTDLAPPEQLTASLEQIADLDLTLHLGGHEERDFRDTDLVVVNPAVPETSEFLQIAQSAGVPITTEINLFVERCPARCVGVTGSVGKSTVTAMIGHVLERGIKGPRDRGIEGSRDRGIEDAADATRRRVPTHARVWVGGNIGRSLLDGLGQIQDEDIVVLELSSFQLQRTPTVRWSPHVAVITNISPNHLDWHGSFEAYLRAKLNIIYHQDPTRGAIVIQDTPELCRAFEHVVGDISGIWRYRLDGDVPTAVMRSTPDVKQIDRRQRWDGVTLGVPGRHNRENAAAALTVASIFDIPAEQAAAALATFEALPHRLQKVAERDGVTYYDDSKSTTPEAALTALGAIEAPLLVILGGYDKGSDLRPLAEEVARRAKFVACIGTTGPTLAEAIRAARGVAENSSELAAAVAACQQRAAPGDVVLLSPACASWDQFPDYRVRGDTFARLARGKLE